MRHFYGSRRYLYMQDILNRQHRRLGHELAELEIPGFQVSFEKPQKPPKPQIRLYFFRGPQKIFKNPK